MRKLKPIPELQTLTPAQLNTLDLWLEDHPYSKVVQLVQEQFGLEISRDKLYRHYHRQRALEQFQDHQDLAQEIADLKLATQASDTKDLCLALLYQKVFDLLGERGHDAKTVKALHNILTYDRDQNLAERRQTLAEHKAGLKSKEAPAPCQPEKPQESPTPQLSPKPSESKASAEIVKDLEAIAQGLEIGITPQELCQRLNIELTPGVQKRIELIREWSNRNKTPAV